MDHLVAVPPTEQFALPVTNQCLVVIHGKSNLFSVAYNHKSGFRRHPNPSDILKAGLVSL